MEASAAPRCGRCFIARVCDVSDVRVMEGLMKCVALRHRHRRRKAPTKRSREWGSGPGDNSPRGIAASAVGTEHLLYGASQAGTVRRNGCLRTAGGEGITTGCYWLVKCSSL
ncbi:hypothetical protein MHYP_G00294510 [Metynnis hypsauchen]